MTARVWVTAVGLLACAGLAAARSSNGPPQLVWNTTASAPEGLYILQRLDRPSVGTWVAASPPPALAAWLDRRDYLPAGALLIKQVAAVAPSRVCRAGAWVTIDGRLRARAESVDRLRRALPAWRGCQRLGAGEVFLLNRAEGSLDSRYFGPLPASAVRGRAVPLLTWSARDAA